MMKVKRLIYFLAMFVLLNDALFSLEATDSKISLGTMFHHALDSLNSGATAEFEFMASKNIGVTGGFGIDLFAENSDAKSYYFSNGINTHFFPESAIDLYLGGRGALTTIVLQGENTMNPTISLYLGSSYYFTKRFFTDFEIGYWIYGFSKDNLTFRSFSSARAILRFGMKLDIFKEKNK